MSKSEPGLAQHPFIKAVAHALPRRCRLSVVRGGRGSSKKNAQAPSQRLLLAVSGGADSVALLRAMHQLSTRRGWKLQLAVGHVQHHLREDVYAQRDAKFVAALAQQFSLPFFRADLDLTHNKPAPNIEAAARSARYAALHEMAVKFGANCIVTAHHGDDQIETMLMRFLRGSSVRGLSGMAWRRRLQPDEISLKKRDDSRPQVFLLRPMLALDHAAATNFLHDIGQTWCEDHTNEDLSRARARLRHQVLPVLRELRADLPVCAARWSDHLRSIAALASSQVEQAISNHVIREADGDHLQWSMTRSAARALPGVVLTGLLRKVLLQAGVEGDRINSRTLGSIVRALRDEAGGKRTFSLQNGATVEITQQSVHILSGRGS